MTLSTKLAQAKEKVVEAAKAVSTSRSGKLNVFWSLLAEQTIAVDALIAIESRMCKECGGDGEHPDYDCGGTLCPSCGGTGERK